MRHYTVLSLLMAGCGSSSGTPDAGVPLDMHIAAPTTLAPAQTLTNCIAVDAANVYWADTGGGTPAIMKVPLGGGAATQVAAGGDRNGCVAVDGAGVYFVDADKIMKAPLTSTGGGSAAPLASGQHVLKGAPLVAAGGFVWWITDVYGNVDAYNGKNAIVRLATAGGSPVEIVSAEVMGTTGGLAVDATNVYYSDQMGVFARPLAMPATAVSFAVQTSLRPTTIAFGGNTLASTEIASVGAGDLAVFRPDGMGRVVISPMLVQPLAVDNLGVYINDQGALERLALDGSGGKLLATQQPRAVALSADHVYFTDGTAIYSLAK